MGNQNSKHMASSPSLRPYLSTDSEFSDPGCSSQHISSRSEVDEKIADRRRRNGESAKRSRQKRKLRLEEMESSYQRLVSGQAQLVEENKKLRELIEFRRGCIRHLSHFIEHICIPDPWII